MGHGLRWSWQDLLALLLLIVAASLAWSKRIGGGDTFVSLAAGRDTLAGKTGLPDEWSFTTENRVWLNQNWGSHTAYYVSWWLMGDTGPVVVKWLVVFGTMLLMIRAATMRGANRVFAATVVAVAILIGRSYIDVRPHIFTLLFEASLVVVFLQWYRGSSAWAFVATAIIGLWSNTHGGFIFGIATMGLWLGVQGLFKLVWSRSRPWDWSHLISFAIALAVAVLLATFANPFGPVNLTHPLVVEKSDVWLSVQEWHPILDKQARFGSVWEYKTLMWVLGGVALAWMVVRLLLAGGGSEQKTKSEGTDRLRDRHRYRKPVAKPQRSTEQINQDWLIRSGLFDVGLMAVTIVMAFRARRFIPLSTVITVPIMLAMFEDALKRLKGIVSPGGAPEFWTPAWRMLLAGVNLGLLIVGCIFARAWIYYPYRDPNPVYPKQSVLMRMVGSQTFPEGSMDFLTDPKKDLPAETFVDWRWEGYTRWRADRLKTFCGGRAQQVHSERVAMWQITTPSQGAKPLIIARIGEKTAINNGKLLITVGRKDGVLAEVSSGRELLGLVRAGVAIKHDGEVKRHLADRTVKVAFHELTEYWADIDITVQRTTTPKYEAQYRLTILGDQPPMSRGTGFCRVQLLALANTDASGYLVVGHSLLMSSEVKGCRGPFGTTPITFWHMRDFRYGVMASKLPGSMAPRIDQSVKPPMLESVGMIQRPLDPKESIEPSQDKSLVFIHQTQEKFHPQGTLEITHTTELRNCRKLIAEAQDRGINIFVLPKQATGLALLLMGSRRWACVYDDGTTYTLLNRGNEKNRKLISDIMAGKVEYPSAYLKALGTALTRWSLAPADTPITPFQEEVKAALKLEPDFSGYWWLVQIQRLYPLARHPNTLAGNLGFWHEQWRVLEQGPISQQHAVRTYQSQQLIAQVLTNSYGELGQLEDATAKREAGSGRNAQAAAHAKRARDLMEKASEWKKRADELNAKMHALREKYI